MLPVDMRCDNLAQSQAQELLEKVGLADRLDHYPRQLSGGEQQRVAIARAFASNPTLLFADEPTGNLDTQTGELICQLLFDLNTEFGTTLIMVTHALQLAARCSRTISISGGKIVPDEQFKVKSNFRDLGTHINVTKNPNGATITKRIKNAIGICRKIPF